MDNCIFCKIVKNELPSYKVYEDDKCMAFLDIHPVSMGHMLLVPKNHYTWIQETPDEIITHAFLTVKKLINKIKENLNADYVQVSVVGKDVAHFHIHLIPRDIKDELYGWDSIDIDKKDFDSILEKLNK